MTNARKATLYCGSTSLELSWFLPAWSELRVDGYFATRSHGPGMLHTILVESLGLPSRRYQHLANTGSFTAYQAAYPERFTLFNLLWHIHRCECSDPRDRFAAIYGLLPQADLISLNYETEDWRSLYFRQAKHLINAKDRSGNILMLHLFDFGPVNRGIEDEYPSWVPNWSAKRIRTVPYLLAHLDSFGVPEPEIDPVRLWDTPGFEWPAIPPTSDQHDWIQFTQETVDQCFKKEPMFRSQGRNLEIRRDGVNGGLYGSMYWELFSLPLST